MLYEVSISSCRYGSNGSVPVPVPKNHTENGREFHGFRKGIYMYPCDEVSFMILGRPESYTNARLTCGCVRSKKRIAWTSSTSSSSSRERSNYIARP